MQLQQATAATVAPCYRTPTVPLGEIHVSLTIRKSVLPSDRGINLVYDEKVDIQADRQAGGRQRYTDA